jgi:CRISPR-associated exonuclease Cas4
MPYSEEDYIMLSALQHYAFCPRQCAFIHKEQVWEENYLTAKGDLFHKRVDNYPTENRKNFKREFSLPICSKELGLSGRTDIVESRWENRNVVEMVPIEYKSGKKKADSIDEIQLCAQALCLEEMTGISIPLGYLYYGKDRKRYEVQLTDTLRKKTRVLAKKIHQLITSPGIPKPLDSPKCKSCSLKEICQPNLLKRRSVSKYINDYMRSQE